MKIKICGITRLEDALHVEKTGLWAVGFIFAENTPRYIDPEKAAKISEKLSDRIEKIGVFLNASVDKILQVSQLVGLSKIQLHGDEPPEFCLEVAQKTGKEVIKAIRLGNEDDLRLIEPYKNSVSYILVDGYCEKSYGGTGKTCDWKTAKKAHSYDLPIILAGGLNPDNILQAYEEVQPYALDLSSGVEISKGIKNLEKIDLLKYFL